ncbi:hypothetical protein NA57DRAFT_29458 [Rhizodiscina lignyota]|uniref:Na+/H+ antiporter n=1 Tax=Rhizodiscina lignyota TaxID=1504668 RepID=A0A9P4IP91_9PEZI|nr:hypothetical protein NA57DRAFT_29458 [Rhizodiscina lignyota]
MAWDHLAINKPHLVYIILGGFTSLFMLCSSVIKERLYIGEATIATLCGIIFGPHAANLINPLSWGNTDQITLEFCRIVLVVQCFAVGVELPKSYMERHWKSVTMLLVPVMTFGWLITSLFIWWLFGGRLNWLDSLCCAACVTATDPVLASSVVGKGKFARRVPKHLRDLLSAESGCNDGMAFPFIYLAIYIIRYHHHPDQVAFHWFCISILYECVFGAIYGVCVGYIARRAIRFAHEMDLIDRESFLVFYFVLALFCAGSGSLLGMDDLLIGFACGVGFSNDGWFLDKTEESHVSNVIDLLINLAFFVYFGTIVPWEQYNSSTIGTSPWRLVVLGIFVILFRRIPIMMVAKPLIPDIKTWREALFAGHFGPIGVGALFVAILARSELEAENSSEPLANTPGAGFPHVNIIQLIWPITTFLVIISIVVHGSSIAVFTLGKHINTLTLTLSYTQANEEGPTWMDRLPRIQSRSKSSMSLRRPSETESSWEEKTEDPGLAEKGPLSPIGLPQNFLRRQKDEEEGRGSRSSSLKPSRRKKKWDTGIGPGGPISQSAIRPISQAARDDVPEGTQTESETLAMNSEEPSDDSKDKEKGKVQVPEEEVYFEGDHTIIEDEEGNVLDVLDNNGETEKEKGEHAKSRGKELMEEKDVEGGVAQGEHDHDFEQPEPPNEQPPNPRDLWGAARRRMESYRGLTRMQSRRDEPPEGPSQEHEKKRGPALAYQYGNTIIVEDESGEVLKKYDIPQSGKPQRPGAGDRKASTIDPLRTRERLARMGTMLGVHRQGAQEIAEGEAGPSDAAGPATSSPEQTKKPGPEDPDDDRIRFTITAGGRRMSKVEFIQQIQKLDPKSRANFVEDSDAPEPVKAEARKDAKEQSELARKVSRTEAVSPIDEEEAGEGDETTDDEGDFAAMRGRPGGEHGLSLVESGGQAVPMHSISDDLARFSFGRETAAQRRRNRIAPQDGEAGPGPGRSSADRDRFAGIERSMGGSAAGPHHSNLEEAETEAERRRRLGALGMRNEDEDSSTSSEDEGPIATGLREPPRVAQTPQQRQGIRFAEAPRPAGAGSGSSHIPRRPGPASSSSGGNGAGSSGGNGAGSSGGNGAGSSGGSSWTRSLRWGQDVGKKKK